MINPESLVTILDKSSEVTKYHRKLYNSIKFLEHANLRLSISKIVQLDPTYLNKDWGPGKMNPPIILAAMRNNCEAVQMLLNTGKVDANIMCCDGYSAICYSCMGGNEKIVNLLLTHGANPNCYTDGQPVLMEAIKYISTYSLVYNAVWENAQIQNELINWYENKSEYQPTSPLRCTWRGNLNLVNLLLNWKIPANPFTSNKQNVNAIKLLQDPKIHLEQFKAASRTKIPFSFIAGTTDVLTFEMGIARRDGSGLLKVIVDYDLRELRTLVLTHANANRDVHSFQAKLDGMLDVHREMAADHNVKKARLNRIKTAKNEPHKEAFYETLSKNFNSLLLAYKVLSTELLQRKENTKTDLASSCLSAIGDHLPFGLGVPAAILAAILKKIADSKEKRKHSRIAHLVDIEHIPLCEQVALRITEHYAQELTKLGDGKEAAEILSKKALELILCCMASPEIEEETKVKLEDGELPLERELANSVIWNKDFNDKIAAMLKKADAKNQKAMLLSKDANALTSSSSLKSSTSDGKANGHHKFSDSDCEKEPSTARKSKGDKVLPFRDKNLKNQKQTQKKDCVIM